MSTVLKVVGASWLRTKISSYILGILGILAILALFVGQIERIQEDGNYAATVFYSEKTGYRIEYWGQSNELVNIPTGVARAYFRMDVDTAGYIQAYAAGVVEGALTWYLIHTHLENTIRDKCEGTPFAKQCNKLKDALDMSVESWKNYADKHASEDPFWHQVSLYYTQINGIYTGWKHGVERSTNEYDTDISDLYWLNSIADVAELQHKLNISIENTTLDKLPNLSSAFLRIVNETDDEGMATQRMFIAHNAVGNYSSMTRILKRYKLNYHYTSKAGSDIIPGTSVDFSGYPGSITSQDEFYVIPVSPRVLAANHLATNVSSWAHILASSNSGTASKQWLVVDFSRFEHLHQAPKTGVKSFRNEVVTESTLNKHVRHTVVHRASTGRTKGLVALIEQDIAETTHIKQMEQLHGQIFSESDSPRAVLFKRGYKNATSLDTIIKLMRQNNVTAMNRASNETSSVGDVESVIAER
ncbi:putative phospholipase B-like lamina ancestor, partial [Operophtera brumata]